METFSRELFSFLHDLRDQQSRVLRVQDDRSYDTHQKLSTLQDDVRSLRNETSSQQDGFRKAFDIVAMKLDEILQIPRTTPTPTSATAPIRNTYENHHILLGGIDTRMKLVEEQLKTSIGDLANRVQAVEERMAKIFEIVRNSRTSLTLTSPNSAQASLAELQKTPKRLPQSFVALQKPAEQGNRSIPTPARSDNHETPRKGTKLPEVIAPKLPIKPPNPPLNPSQTCEPDLPLWGARWSTRLEKRKKSTARPLFPRKSKLTEGGTPRTGPLKEPVDHGESAPSSSLGKRKRNSVPPKSGKKRTTSSITAVKGKEVVQCDEDDQSPVMVLCNKCDGWYHIKCVELDENDLCMTQEDVPYTCPPCNSPKTLTVFRREGKYDCGAPGCVIPRQKPGNGVFYIDKLVGRKPIKDRNSDGEFSWLVKFDGYPIDACLWKPEDRFDAKALKVEFNATAIKEGILSTAGDANDREVLLLREAADHGGPWADDEA